MSLTILTYILEQEYKALFHKIFICGSYYVYYGLFARTDLLRWLTMKTLKTIQKFIFFTILESYLRIKQNPPKNLPRRTVRLCSKFSLIWWCPMQTLMPPPLRADSNYDYYYSHRSTTIPTIESILRTSFTAVSTVLWQNVKLQGNIWLTTH